MTVEIYIVLAVILIGWYVLNMDGKQKGKEVKKEIAKIKTPEEIMKETTEMYERINTDLDIMFKESRKRLGLESSSTKTTNKGAKANAK